MYTRAVMGVVPRTDTSGDRPRHEAHQLVDIYDARLELDNHPGVDAPGGFRAHSPFELLILSVDLPGLLEHNPRPPKQPGV